MDGDAAAETGAALAWTASASRHKANGSDAAWIRAAKVVRVVMRALLPTSAAGLLRRSCRRNETAAVVGKSSAISDGEGR